MADRLKRAAAWLGLVTDDRYPDYDDTEPTEGVSRDDLLAESEDRSRTNGAAGQQPRQTVPTGAQGNASVTPLETRRDPVVASSTGGSAAAQPSYATAAQTSTAPVVSAAPESQPERADLSRIVTVHPRSFNDARTIGEHFRDGVPVIMNLTQMENADAKRLVDFAAGLILGLRGNIERVTSKVFLLSPQNVTVAAEDKERIAGGFFNQS